VLGPSAGKYEAAYNDFSEIYDDGHNEFASGGPRVKVYYLRPAIWALAVSGGAQCQCMKYM
jgi:hypothetical protein